MGKRKQDEGQANEPRKMVTRQEKGKDKDEGTPSRKEESAKAPALSPSSTEEVPVRGIRFKSVGKKKSVPKEVKIVGNPSLQFRNREHRERFDGLKKKNIFCGREFDWKSFKSSDLFAFFKTIFEVMKWDKLANFDEFEYSEILVKEFYASLPTISDKNKRNQDETLDCFVNGMEVTITAKDLGTFLSTEHVFGMTRRPADFDVDQVWKEFTDSSQTIAQNPASSLFNLASLKILHAFINGTILGRQGSHSSVSRDELWVMHQAMQQIRINTAQFILDNIKTVGSNVKFVLPYGNILTSYFKSKRLWNSRYENSLRENSRKPITGSSLLDNLFTLQGKQWVKKAQTERTKPTAQDVEEDDTDKDEPAAEPTSKSSETQSIVELFSRIEVSIQNLRIEVNEKFDLQDAKLNALTEVVKKVEQQMTGMHAYGPTAEGDSGHQNEDTPSGTQKLDSEEVGNAKAAQKEDSSRKRHGKQTLEHLSEAASTFETQTDPKLSPIQTNPKLPDDMLFMFSPK